MSTFNEPWRIEERKDFDFEKYVVLLDANGDDAISVTRHGGDCCDCSGRLDLSDSEAARIVACVNACAGIPTEDVVETIELWKEFYFR